MKRVLKWIGIGLGSLILLAMVAGGALYVAGGSKLSAKHDVAAEQELTIPSDSTAISRGAQLIASRACGACHGEDLGGKVMEDAGPFAHLVAPNLTRGRGGRNPPRTDLEWERAIRHGVRRDGTGLVVMPSEIFHRIADNEMTALIAYLREMPPVDRDVPPLQIRWLGRIFVGAGAFKTAAALVADTPHVAVVDTTPGLEFGKYIVSVSGCQGCHGESFSGGPGLGPGSPPASNITPGGIGHYTEEDFVRALRTGVRPGGGASLNEAMPWKFYGKMNDGELHSIWTFLKSLPSKQFAEK